LHVSGRLGPRNPDDRASAFPIPPLKRSTYSGKRLCSREPFRSPAKCDFRTTRQVRIARLQKDSSALCQLDAPGSSRAAPATAILGQPDAMRQESWHTSAFRLESRLSPSSSVQNIIGTRQGTPWRDERIRHGAIKWRKICAHTAGAKTRAAAVCRTQALGSTNSSSITLRK
jgi:hypothetical protein